MTSHKERDRYGFALFAFLALTICACPSAAFSGKEHEALTNDALRLIADTCDHVGRAEPPEASWNSEVCDRFKEAAAWSDPDGRPSLGQFNAAMDWVIEPSRAFFPPPHAPEPLEPSRCAGERVSLQRENDLFSHPRLTRVLQWLRAAHNDDIHFQEQALESFVAWHETALTSARCAARISTEDRSERRRSAFLGALAIDAMALHYLQDFHAPGHALTFKKTMHDVGAMCSHDFFNYTGSEFQLTERLIGGPLFVVALNHELSSKPTLTEITGDPIDPRVVQAAKARLRTQLSSSSSLLFFGDGALERACTSPLSTPRTTTERSADDGIDRHHENAYRVEACAQRLFLTLLSAQSFGEVAGAFALGGDAGASSFENITWSPMRMTRVPDSTRAVLTLAHGGTEFGAFSPLEKSRLGRILYHGTAIGFGISTLGPVFQGEEQSSSRQQARVELLPTLLASGRASRADGVFRAKSTQMGATLGYTWDLYEPDLSVDGPAVRGVLAFPAIDFMISADLRYQMIRIPGSKRDRLAYGLRGDLGFSLATFFFEFGEDYFLQGDTLEPELYVSAGFTFAISASKIPGIRNFGAQKREIPE